MNGLQSGPRFLKSKVKLSVTDGTSSDSKFQGLMLRCLNSRPPLQTSFLMLVLAFELEVTSDMTLNNMCRDAMVVPDEFVGQSGAGKVSLRLRKDRLFRPSVHRD